MHTPTSFFYIQIYKYIHTHIHTHLYIHIHIHKFQNTSVAFTISSGRGSIDPLEEDPLEEKPSPFYCCKEVQDECGVGGPAVDFTFFESTYTSREVGSSRVVDGKQDTED